MPSILFVRVSGLRNATLASLWTQIARDIAEGQLAAGTNVDSLACFVGTIVQGMSVQGKDGATRKRLTGIAKFASEAIARNRA